MVGPPRAPVNARAVRDFARGRSPGDQPTPQAAAHPAATAAAIRPYAGQGRAVRRAAAISPLSRPGRRARRRPRRAGKKPRQPLAVPLEEDRAVLEERAAAAALRAADEFAAVGDDLVARRAAKHPGWRGSLALPAPPARATRRRRAAAARREPRGDRAVAGSSPAPKWWCPAGDRHAVRHLAVVQHRTAARWRGGRRDAGAPRRRRGPRRARRPARSRATASAPPSGRGAVSAGCGARGRAPKIASSSARFHPPGPGAGVDQAPGGHWGARSATARPARGERVGDNLLRDLANERLVGGRVHAGPRPARGRRGATADHPAAP